MFRTDDFAQVATIPVGKLPHGVWPSGDGTRVYVGLENADALAAIDTLTNKVIATIPIGQAPQAVDYVPERGAGGRRHAGPAAARRRRRGGAPDARAASGSARPAAQAPTSVSLFDQGLIQVLQAAVTGLEPKQPYVLALATSAGRQRRAASRWRPS